MGIPGLATKCPLPWNALPGGGLNKDAVCPWGQRLPGDVTLPNDSGVVEWICVVYGYIPFVIIGLDFAKVMVKAVIYAVRHQPCFRTKDWSFLFYVVFITFMNEVLFKRLVSQPRPDKSCNTSCGMPSGHSTMAVGFFTLALIDAVFRVVQMDPKTKREAKTMHNFRHRLTKFTCMEMISSTPLAPKPVLSHGEFLAFFACWFVLLIPVPFTRTVLNDHTAAQVMLGSSIGIIEAVVWYWAAHRYLQSNPNYGEKMCGCCMHDYALPLPQVRSDALRLVVEGPESDEAEVEDVQRELAWYLEMLPGSRETEDEDEEIGATDAYYRMERRTLEVLQQQLSEVQEFRNTPGHFEEVETESDKDSI